MYLRQFNVSLIGGTGFSGVGAAGVGVGVTVLEELILGPGVVDDTVTSVSSELREDGLLVFELIVIGIGVVELIEVLLVGLELDASVAACVMGVSVLLDAMLGAALVEDVEVGLAVVEELLLEVGTGVGVVALLV